MNDTSQSAFSVKEWLVFLPVLGSFLAVVYDLGFFYGVDIRYYTIFSLPEHIGFALQAIPLAFSLATGFVVGWLLRAKSRSAPRGSLRQRLTKRGIAIFWTYIVVVIATAVAEGFLKQYYGASILFLIVAVSAFIFFVDEFRVAIFAVLFGAVALIFLLGGHGGEELLAGKTVTQSITLKEGQDELRGILVRSGDRGILFFDMGKRVVSLVPWDGIKRIQSVN
jgi:hypothetical protein